MKIEEIKKRIYGSNFLDCMVWLDNYNGKVFFTDDTIGIFTEIKNQTELNQLLENNTFNN